MRLLSPLPQLLVAGAALGGLLAPFAVGGAPTDARGIAAPSRPFGADFPICRGYGSTGLNGGVLHHAQLRTEASPVERTGFSVRMRMPCPGSPCDGWA